LTVSPRSKPIRSMQRVTPVRVLSFGKVKRK
jgi:hypothetical protein